MVYSGGCRVGRGDVAMSPRLLLWLSLAASLVAGCSQQQPPASDSPSTEAASASEAAQAQSLVPATREDKIALGLAHASAWDLYQALKARANGGVPLTPSTMPDWTGLWTRVGRPFFDPDQEFTQLTTAKLKPDTLADLKERREQSAKGIEYDPISDCSPPGFPRWLAIPFLREFIVTPGETYLFSETVNNMRRIYTDGRGHPSPDDAYPLYYGDSIGFWTADGDLVIHTNQIKAGIFHRNDPKYSDKLEVVEVWHKADAETITADVWSYDPENLEEPWYVQQTYKQVPNPNKELRINYWFCGENPNNTIIKTDEGTSEFSDFTFDKDKTNAKDGK